MNTQVVYWLMWTWIRWMKETNQKQPKLPLLRQPEGEKLNKRMIQYYKRAGIIGCLFLCCFGSKAFADDQQWKFDAPTQKAYDLALNLKFKEVHELITDAQTAQELYVVSLAEAIELLLEEDGEKYTEYQSAFEKRKDRKTKLNSPDDLFLQAELAIQWSFVYFKFGHEFDAALNLRDAYSITSALRKRYPKYVAIKKTAALLEIIVGSVPEKYNWVLSLLNIEGSVDVGLKLFDDVHQAASPLILEADLLHALVLCYILQQPQAALTAVRSLQVEHEGHPLVLFLGASVAIKDSKGELALTMLNKLEAIRTSTRLDYADYLFGEVYLCKAEYLNSISAYRSFLANYKGQNNIKDANYKIGLCYYLNGNSSDAISTFKLARNTGKEVTEGDKYAARSLSEDELPHPLLTKARYSIDGGYYDKAKLILDSIRPADIPTARDQVEFFYRRARLEHKLNQVDAATADYKKVIELNVNSPWYFAPNSSLQLGYIHLANNETKAAEQYFEMALSYKKHEYKNSIDTKARSALDQIKRK
ncbi:MAG: hypothetical protein ABI477_13180 [Chryseolinea sp.]